MPFSWLHSNDFNNFFRNAISAITASSKTENNQQYIALSIDVEAIPASNVLREISSTCTSFYLENTSESFSMVAEGMLEKITASGTQRFKTTSHNGKDLFNRIHHFSQVNTPHAIHLVGGFSFTDELDRTTEWTDFETSLFHLPEWLYLQQGQKNILSFIEVFNPELSVESWSQLFEARIREWRQRFNPDEIHLNSNGITSLSSKKNNIKTALPFNSLEGFEEWKILIEEAKHQIADQRFKKVVLARKLSLPLRQQPPVSAIVDDLIEKYPDCYVFAFNPKGESFFTGATPERLARFTPTQVQTESLAGSTTRGKDPVEDNILAGQLLNSKKDRLEHTIVIEAIEEDLFPYSEQLVLSKSPQVKKLPNVQHLYTPISATFKEGVSRTNVLKDLHPTPAVGGFPRDKALHFIHQEEHFNRGWYAAPIGWINADGIGEFYVAIRSGLIQRNIAHFYAGCGIVEDSDPETEWMETELKLQPMMNAVSHAIQQDSEELEPLNYESDTVL